MRVFHRFFQRGPWELDPAKSVLTSSPERSPLPLFISPGGGDSEQTGGYGLLAAVPFISPGGGDQEINRNILGIFNNDSLYVKLKTASKAPKKTDEKSNSAGQPNAQQTKEPYSKKKDHGDDGISQSDHVPVIIYNAPSSDSISWFENLLNNISVISGFLVLATYPIIFQDLSETVARHFTVKTIHTFAALAVGLFVAEIVLCLNFKKIMGGRPNFYRFQYFLVLIVLELLTGALMFFFLAIAASVWIVGLVFAAIDGFCAILVLVLWFCGLAGAVGRGNDTGAGGQSKPDTASRQGTSTV